MEVPRTSQVFVASSMGLAKLSRCCSSGLRSRVAIVSRRCARLRLGRIFGLSSDKNKEDGDDRCFAGIYAADPYDVVGLFISQVQC